MTTPDRPNCGSEPGMPKRCSSWPTAIRPGPKQRCSREWRSSTNSGPVWAPPNSAPRQPGLAGELAGTWPSPRCRVRPPGAGAGLGGTLAGGRAAVAAGATAGRRRARPGACRTPSGQCQPCCRRRRRCADEKTNGAGGVDPGPVPARRRHPSTGCRRAALGSAQLAGRVEGGGVGGVRSGRSRCCMRRPHGRRPGVRRLGPIEPIDHELDGLRYGLRRLAYGIGFRRVAGRSG